MSMTTELAKTKELAFLMTERFSMNPINCKHLNEAWREEFPDEVAVAKRMLALVEALEAAERRSAEYEGMVFVPVEPTLDQLVAGKRRLTSTGRMSRLMSQRLAEVYRAMVGVAVEGE